MKTSRRMLKLITRYSLLITLPIGCSQPAAEPQPSAELPTVVIAPSVAVPGDPKPVPQPSTAPVAFAFTPDLTGQALPRAVAPPVPVKLPGERFGGEPKPRAVPSKILDPDTPARANYALAPILPAKPGAAVPAAPPERLPLNLGAGVRDVPAKPVLPVAAVVTERSRDVNIPPPAPTLGRRASDRVPFDDPTNEVGNAVVASGTVPVPLGTSGFLKVTVPDPFELGAQVKPSIPPVAEPGAAPIAVNPQRVK